MKITTGLLIVLLAVGGSALPGAAQDKDGKECAACHEEQNPGLYLQWRNSAHGREDVSCYDCHKAEKDDADAFEHHGATIATLVTPKDCSQCHPEEAEQTMNSYHAKAGQILESADAFLAHVTGGKPTVIVGCESCHGARVVIDPEAENRLSLVSWPNSGIGRINPDGSLGACNACHQRHAFSKAQARRPGNCGKCHLGPDHPQKEIYDESKHGIAFHANEDELNIKQDKWVVGADYYQGPSCATCHMSATLNQAVTHDVGDRISWTLRPPVSKHKENWQARRDNMKDVCTACHQDNFVNGHYYQYDALVRLYNEKFAQPATEIDKMIKEKGLRERDAAFANEYDWIYWELWHHEGRRARMGAAMMGPDYTWWHGIYDVAHNFYFEFLPAARAFNNKEINAYIDNLLQDPMHAWLKQSGKELKGDIRSGNLQEVYAPLFSEPPVQGESKKQKK